MARVIHIGSDGILQLEDGVTGYLDIEVPIAERGNRVNGVSFVVLDVPAGTTARTPLQEVAGQ